MTKIPTEPLAVTVPDINRFRPHAKAQYCLPGDWQFLLNKISQSSGTIVEVGTLMGDTAYEIAMAFPRRPLWCFDLPWEERDPGYRGMFPGGKYFHRAEKLPWVTLANPGWNWSVPEGTTFVFIDADHSLIGVRHDTRIALEYFRSTGTRGTIAWHDYDARTGPGVIEYIDALAFVEDLPIKYVEHTMTAYLDL